MARSCLALFLIVALPPLGTSSRAQSIEVRNYPACPSDTLYAEDGFPYLRYDCLEEGYLEPNRVVPGDSVRYLHPSYVTVPADASRPMPLLVMLHGYAQDRNWYSNPDVTTNTISDDQWNAESHARKGYAVLTLTARGHRDRAMGPASAINPQAKYWAPVQDMPWDVRDAQHLIGKLVDAGLADPARIGVTGVSYGGGRAWLLALLEDEVVLPDGTRVPWTSPGGTPLRIRAAVPFQPMTDVTMTVAPNGRMDVSRITPTEELVCPLGVVSFPILTLAGALVEWAPPGVDSTADLRRFWARLEAGPPFDVSAMGDSCVRVDSLVSLFVSECNRRSPRYLLEQGILQPSGQVPVFNIAGLADAQQRAWDQLQMLYLLRDADPTFPVKTYLGGNMGHSYGNPESQWQLANDMADDFLDYYLLDAGTEPVFDVTVVTGSCETVPAPLTDSKIYIAPDWSSLSDSDSTETFQSPASQTTLNPAPGDPDFDPFVSHFVLAQECVVDSTVQAPGAAFWDFVTPSPIVVCGQPEGTLSFNTTADDVQLNGILWYLSDDGLERTLLTFGPYRHLAAANPPGSPDSTVSYGLMPMAWEIPARTTLRFEIRSDARPHFQNNNVSSTTDIHEVTLTLPRVTWPTVGVAPPGAVPLALQLANAPNPFRPATTIAYAIPRAGAVTLAVYDVRGRRVATLADGWRAGGAHRVLWDGTSDAGARVASGIYLYRLEVLGSARTERLAVLR